MTVNSLILSYLFLSTIQISLSDVYVYNNLNKTFAQFEDQEGSFYPSIPSDGIYGYITTTSPLTACEKISPPPNIPTSGYQWIALIPRTREGGSCPFVDKIQNAYEANFSAVIIYNYEDELPSMGPYGKNVNIPSTLITNTNGLALIKNYLYDKTFNSTPIYHIEIIPKEPFNFGIYLVLFVLVIGVSFFGLLGFMLVKWHLQRRRMRRHRLPRSALKQLKIKKFVKGDPWDVCAICLDDYIDGAKLRILPCEHAYHLKCIDPWLLNNRRQCPVCKRYVFPNHDNSDEEENHNNQPARIPTEQTPLINSNDSDSVTEIPRSRQLPERQLLNPSGSGIPNVSFTSNDTSDDEKELSLSSRPTTAELAFDRSSSNSRRYGSMNGSSHATNFFVGSSGGTTDNTNISAHYIVENASDIETTEDDDERMHSVVMGSQENPVYTGDEQSLNTNQTHL